MADMADEEFTPEELELLDEMIANLKSINRLLSNSFSAGEKNSRVEPVLIDLPPIQPIPSEIESTMVVDLKEDQIEDAVDDSLDLVNTKGAVQVTNSFNNGGLGANISHQVLKPFVLEIHPTAVPIEQNNASVKVELEQPIYLYIPDFNRQLDWKSKQSDFPNFMVNLSPRSAEQIERKLDIPQDTMFHCLHWASMTRMESIEQILAQIDELQLMLIAPVTHRLPPKPPDIRYATVGFAHTDLDEFINFFGVYDGHGGKVIAKFCTKFLHQQIVELEIFTFSMALKACTDLSNALVGRAIHAQIMKHREEADQVVNNALLKFYMECGCFDEVLKVFEVMPQRNVVSFSQQGHRAICILFASGTITLRQPWFEILSVSISCMPTENGFTKSRSGGMCVSLAGPDDRVMGGGLAGLLVVAGPAQVDVASFIPGQQLEHKSKKPRMEHISTTATTHVPPISTEEIKISFGGVKPIMMTLGAFQMDNNYVPYNNGQTGAIHLEYYQWLPNFIKQTSMIDERTEVSVKIIEDVMVCLYYVPIFNGYWFATLSNFVISQALKHAFCYQSVAVVSLLISSQFSAVVDLAANPEAYRNLVFNTTLIAGIFQAAFGVFRLGFLVDFLSHTAFVGFMAGATIIIGLQQLNGLLGLSHFTSNTDAASVLDPVYKSLNQQITFKEQWSPLKFVIGCSFRIYLAAIASLISVVLSTLIMYWSKADKHGVNIIKHIKSGLNPSSAHQLQFHGQYVGHAAKIGLIYGVIALTEAIVVGQFFASIKGYHLDRNKEMLAMGYMNIAGSLTSCYVATGSFSRPTVNFSAGYQTSISNIVNAVIAIWCLEVFTRLLYYNPRAILASIILFALPGLIDINEACYIGKVDKFDFLTCVGAFFSVLFKSVETGLLVAVSISFAKILIQSIRLEVEIRGRVPRIETLGDVVQYAMATIANAIAAEKVNSVTFKSFNGHDLEDKVNFKGDGIVTDGIAKSAKSHGEATTHYTTNPHEDKNNNSVDRESRSKGRVGGKPMISSRLEGYFHT